MSEDLIRKKIYAYLHDPFHKPYVVTRTLKLRDEDYCKDLKAHEEEAVWVFKHLFGKGEDLCKALKEKELEAYDKIASVLDRLLIPKGSGSSEGGVNFLNPFDPRVTFPISYNASDKIKIKEFYEELKKLLENCDIDEEPAKCYHLLYSASEPLWYKIVGKPPVADTRVPTHTVFDHNSATATMANVFNGESFEGYLVELDIPGIQGFVSSGRGPGDLWARSWLLSALAWYSVKEFVERLGPDILIVPSARYNPFYVSTVYAMLSDKEREVFKKALEGIKVNLLDISQPVIPATIRMYLPKEVCKMFGKEGGKDCIKEILLKRFEEGWRKVVEASLKALEEKDLPKGAKIFLDKRQGFEAFLIAEENERIRELVQKGDLEEKDLKYFREELKKVLDESSTPLKPVVTVVDLAEAFKEFSSVWEELVKDVKKEVEERFEGIEFEYVNKEELVNKNLKYWFFLYWLFGVRFRREKELESSIRVEPKALNGWTFEAFKKAYKDGKAPAKLCPCGSPAIINNSLKEPALFLRSNEALCPFCYALRLLQYNLKDVVRELFGPLPIPKAPRLSTATLAALPELADLLSKKVAFLDKNLAVKSYGFEELVEALKGALPVPQSTFKEKPAVPFEFQRLLEALREGEDLFFTIKVGEEKAYLSVREFEELRKEIENLNKYIALVRGDGDEMGNIASGRLRLSAEEYFKEIYKYEGERIASGIASIIRTFTKALPEELGGKAQVPTTLPTPSYVAQFSYAQMISALLDAKIVEANFGVLVFAGGDDVVAIFPARSKAKEALEYVKKRMDLNWARLLEPYTSPALEGWWLTRLNYWGLRQGFHHDKGLFSPALVAYGRKYGIAIRHYRDPLSLVYREANALEEKAKDLKRTFNNKEMPKDGTAVSYGRAGGAEGTAMPNTTFAKRLEDMYCSEGTDCKTLAYISNWLISKVLEGKLSRNFFYDLLESYKNLEGLEAPKEVFANLLIATAMDNSHGNGLVDAFKDLAKALEEEEFFYDEKAANPFSAFVRFVMEWYKAVR